MTFYSSRFRTESLTEEESHDERMRSYLTSIRRCGSRQTWLQFLNECLRDGLGLRGSVSEQSVAERRKAAIERWPDKFEPWEGR